VSSPRPTHETPDNTTEEIALPRRGDDVDSSLVELDEPIDDQTLESRMVRRGMARSTRWLLVAIAVIAVFAVGALIGRATAPAPAGPASPPLAGVVESLDPAPNGATLTLRSGDVTLTTMLTTPGTRVSVVRRDGMANLSRGTNVEVSTQGGLDGSLTATRIDLQTAN
jgi:hypothetical protein